MTISSFNRITVDQSALEHNFRLINSMVHANTRVLAMVKSDAYGHGLCASAEAFSRAGCDLFGVAEIGEAVELRESGCQGDILIFLGLDHANIAYLFSHDLTPLLFSRDDISAVAMQAEQKRKQIGIFLKFDCGMSRLGFKPEEASDLAARLKDHPFVKVLGTICHFPSSDDRCSRSTDEIYRCFRSIAEKTSWYHSLVASSCNSGGTLYFPKAHGAMVRDGISLYGYYPDGSVGRPEAEDGLKPAMTFTSRVLQINEVPAGTGVSYGHTFITERQTKLAVLPVGYSDGYFRGLSNRAEVLIRGQRAPIRGRICMNLCMADVTDLVEDVCAGDEVVLLGTQGDESIDADEIGGWCGTISYEVLCSLGNNNERTTIETK